MQNSSKNRMIAVSLALGGAFNPSPLPIAGLHKFYLNQPGWGIIYLVLGWTQIPRIASAIEGLWLLAQGEEGFHRRFLSSTADIPLEAASRGVNPAQVEAVANALRELDRLRQEGLISEYEFEQKRRNLLDQIA